jgi:hypothetical protein
MHKLFVNNSIVHFYWLYTLWEFVFVVICVCNYFVIALDKLQQTQNVL